MYKKYLILLLSTLCLFVLISCNSETTSTNNNTTSTNESNDNSKTDVKDISSFEEENNNSSNENLINTKSRNVRLFYYDGLNDKICYEDKSITIEDGALVTAIINELKANKGDKYCALDSSIVVKSAKLDSDNDLLTVNFGEKFVNNMNLGSGAESSVLQAIVNSLGYNFNVSKVYITVDGKSYASGHIIKEEGEVFKVDYKNISQI